MWIKVLAVVFIVLGGAVYLARKTSSVVHVERTFNAPVSKVWQLWTDAESMKKWWSPKDYTAPVIKSDFKVGGFFLLSMRSPKGELFWNVGRYMEIVQNEKIVSVMSFSDENGNVLRGRSIPVPGVWPDEIRINIQFKELNGKTLVQIDEVGIPLIMKLFAGMGWEQQFDKFDLLLK